MNQVTTFLWYDTQAIDAARFYVSLFPDAELQGVDGMSARFQLGTQSYIAFNGGPHYALNPSVSLFVDCPTQTEIDSLWSRLLAGGGHESRCGWLVDRYGLSWQVIPAAVLAETMGGPDPVKAKRATEALMGMVKIDIGTLKKVYDGV